MKKLKNKIIIFQSLLIVILLVTLIMQCLSELETSVTDAKVTKVIDGDTIQVLFNDGTQHSVHRVRLIGIDTPEVGRCGYLEAKNYLEKRILGETVSLKTGGTSDQDGLNRLLRYVELNDVDQGLALLESGLAIHKYDSTDTPGKYAAHDRELIYIKADEKSDDFC
jgi:endonuclease YncB( thermonuclease family)